MAMKKTLFLLIPVLLSVSFCGCTSYSLRGLHTKMSPMPEPGSTYYLRSYSADLGWPNGWSVAKCGGKQIIKQEIANGLHSSYPERFPRTADGIPVDVKVTLVDSKCNMWGLVPYFLTLGVYPANVIRYTDTCDVSVSVGGIKRTGRVKFRTNSWLSVWTPFGLSRTDSPDEYNGEHRRGSGIMMTPSIYRDQSDIYISEVVEEISAQLAKGSVP